MSVFEVKTSTSGICWVGVGWLFLAKLEKEISRPRSCKRKGKVLALSKRRDNRAGCQAGA